MALEDKVLHSLFHSLLPYGIFCHMDARQLFKDKFHYGDGAIREMVIWELPKSSPERPHGLKYRLFYGYPGQYLVRYDNEAGKGDHRHYEDREENYSWESVEQLINDFRTDIERLRGEHE